MGGGIAIKRYGTRWTPLRLQRFPEQELGSRYIATGTQSEINSPAFPVLGAHFVQVPISL
jgi:hypothetical protein